jgi:hypothetical protein
MMLSGSTIEPMNDMSSTDAVFVFEAGDFLSRVEELVVDLEAPGP